MSLETLLRAGDVLADLTDAELHTFAALGESRHVAPGDVVQLAGVPWSGLVALLEGALRAEAPDNASRHVPRGTLPEWSTALAGETARARYTAPWGGAHIIVWPQAVVDTFFSQRPHLAGLVRQRVDALPSPRPSANAAPGSVIPLHTEVAPRPTAANWRRAALRWRLQTRDQKSLALTALVALTIAQWVPMVYVRFVIGTTLAEQHQTRAWVLGLACAWAMATLIGLTPWRRNDDDVPAKQMLRLWLVGIGMVLCAMWLAITAWPLAAILCLGQLVCCICAVRLGGLRNHRHPTYIVLQSVPLNRKTSRWRNTARLANLTTTGALVIAGARALQTGEVDMGDFVAAVFLGMMMQHAWRESFAQTLIVDSAASPPLPLNQGSILNAPDVRITPGQRLGVVGTSGAGLSWTAASAAHCVALPRAIVPVHAPLQDGTLGDFIGSRDDSEALAQALRWSGADGCVAALRDGLHTHITRFDKRFSLQERVCLHAARLMLEGPAGAVFDGCLDLIDPDLAQVLLTNLACALPHTRLSIVTHQAEILRRCHRVALLAPNQALQEGDFYGLWTRGVLAPLTWYTHA